MEKEVTIDYMGIELIVIGDYYEQIPSVQYDADFLGYPGDGPYFEANEIFVSDSNINIIEMLINLQLNEIEELVLIKLEK